jgi:hypothetical protein
MALGQIKEHLITTARMTDREVQAFCERVIELAQQGQAFTAWEASRAALQPLIVGHPGLRHAQTREAVHALMGSYLASGAYHAESVHAGPGRDPLLYYPNEPGLRSWLAARPGYYLLREGPPQPHVPSANEIAVEVVRVARQVGGAAAVAEALAETNGCISLGEAANLVGILPQNAERRAMKSPSACYHSAGEDPPEPYRNHGPIEGTKKYLASLVYVGGKADRRSLDSLVKDGLLWGQRIHNRLYRIWFRQSGDLRAAEKAAGDNRRRGQEESDSK